jgi:hypothetical protein
MTNAQNITLALQGRWHGHYGLAFCPAHPNTRTPALRLADGEDGRLLALCSAGCDFRDVAARLSLIPPHWRQGGSRRPKTAPAQPDAP